MSEYRDDLEAAHGEMNLEVGNCLNHLALVKDVDELGKVLRQAYSRTA